MLEIQSHIFGSERIRVARTFLVHLGRDEMVTSLEANHKSLERVNQTDSSIICWVFVNHLNHQLKKCLGSPENYYARTLRVVSEGTIESISKSECFRRSCP